MNWHKTHIESHARAFSVCANLPVQTFIHKTSAVGLSWLGQMAQDHQRAFSVCANLPAQDLAAIKERVSPHA